MKTKRLILLSLVFFCISCDISKPFIINGKKEYVFSDECGTIKIKGSSLLSSIAINCSLNGKYCIDTDALKIETFSSEDTITILDFVLNNKILTEKKIETKSGDVLNMRICLLSTVPNRGANRNFLLLPSDFITCEGKPVITDTIRIQLRMYGGR